MTKKTKPQKDTVQWSALQQGALHLTAQAWNSAAISHQILQAIEIYFILGI